jgi:hypothetical protein
MASTREGRGRVFHWISGRYPWKYALDFGLWMRAIVVALIGKKRGVKRG